MCNNIYYVFYNYKKVLWLLIIKYIIMIITVMIMIMIIIININIIICHMTVTVTVSVMWLAWSNFYF